MKLLFDIFPVFLFFIFYKLYDIYFATSVAMASSVLQVFIYRIRMHRYEKIHLISLALILVLGSATLFFRNPWFIKWKPTGIYWLTSLVFLGSFFIGKKPLIQKMMEKNIQLPLKIWQRLNGAWSLFFFIMGAINLYIAYCYSTDTWVTFKLFGGLGSTLFFVLIQAVYLTRHTSGKSKITTH